MMKMNLLKKYFVFLMAVVLCLGLTACGGTDDTVDEDEGKGDVILDEDEGKGDLIQEEDNGVWVLTAGELPFANVESLQAETYEDGTYYYADVAEDGLIKVVNTVQPRDFSAEDTEAYLIDCALSLGDGEIDRMVSFETNEAYTQQMTFPVYGATYTTGENEDTREWAVFVMETDLYTYLYGISVAIDSADEMWPAIEDVFASLYLSEPA